MLSTLARQHRPGRPWAILVLALATFAGSALAAGRTARDAGQPEPTAEPRLARDDPKNFEATPQGHHPGHRGRRDGPPPGLWNRMSDAEQNQVHEFIEEHFPRMYEELQRLKERHPDRFRQRMRRVVPELLHVMEIMELDPERGALMIQERRLDIRMRFIARRHRSAENEERRTQLAGEMRALCAEAFDIKHQRRALEIRRLEARIAELKDRHEETAKMREQLIERATAEQLSRRPRRGPVQPGDPPPHGEP